MSVDFLSSIDIRKCNICFTWVDYTIVSVYKKNIHILLEFSHSHFKERDSAAGEAGDCANAPNGAGALAGAAAPTAAAASTGPRPIPTMYDSSLEPFG